ncbi:VCBS repeat-containing protein [Sphingomonas sinipercae]|uniref:VCBS repeat-containing protein n=1 Tax=Sphingomonas sinipercae TaxID=2714944 RepID=A0A6G7ZPE3_9SPHN|nr:VCBS repeat-containing protein [Sphingomonas sinipercae]QIL02770.1 VCBS repeat-containing protein [Sphingomonas sinipercae]
MPRIDFDGDGRDDIIFRNTETGAVSNWRGGLHAEFTYNEAAGMDTYAVGDLVAIGDFDGDGRSDTLWMTADGNVSVSYTVEDGAFYLAWTLSQVTKVPAGWQVAGTGDFDGDSIDDIVWRAADGSVITWLGKDQFQGDGPGGNLLIPNDWKIVGTGDFNGDGRDDILWRSDNGTVTNWLGRADGSFINNHINTGEVIPLDWHIVGTGDFNGDGNSDILWRSDAGTVTNWLGQDNGGFINNHANTGQVIPLDWHIVGTGDFNGDGRSDVLWRSDHNVITDWIGQDNGGFGDNPVGFYLEMPLAWQIPLYSPGLGLWDY